MSPISRSSLARASPLQMTNRTRSGYESESSLVPSECFSRNQSIRVKKGKKVRVSEQEVREEMRINIGKCERMECPTHVRNTTQITYNAPVIMINPKLNHTPEQEEFLLKISRCSGISVEQLKEYLKKSDDEDLTPVDRQNHEQLEEPNPSKNLPYFINMGDPPVVTKTGSSIPLPPLAKPPALPAAIGHENLGAIIERTSGFIERRNNGLVDKSDDNDDSGIRSDMDKFFGDSEATYGIDENGNAYISFTRTVKTRFEDIKERDSHVLFRALPIILICLFLLILGFVLVSQFVAKSKASKSEDQTESKEPT